MTKFDWTPLAIETLTEMWEGGRTGGDISLRLGCSRSAVIGKVHRLGLKKRDNPVDGPTISAKFDLMVEMIAEHNYDLIDAAAHAGLSWETGKRMWRNLCEIMGVPVYAGADRIIERDMQQ